jgi:hypothetical protein
MNFAMPNSGANIGKNIAITVITYCMICLVPTKDLNRVKDIDVTLPSPTHEMIVEIILESSRANMLGRLTIVFLAKVFIRLRKPLRL